MYEEATDTAIYNCDSFVLFEVTPISHQQIPKKDGNETAYVGRKGKPPEREDEDREGELLELDGVGDEHLQQQKHISREEAQCEGQRHEHQVGVGAVLWVGDEVIRWRQRLQ